MHIVHLPKSAHPPFSLVSMLAGHPAIAMPVDVDNTSTVYHYIPKSSRLLCTLEDSEQKHDLSAKARVALANRAARALPA